MSSRAAAAALVLALVALLVGCAAKPQGSVVLLPDAQGRDTAVIVSHAGGQLVLDKPYAAAQLTRDGALPTSANAEQVQARFGEALAARPLPPASFTLYFIEGRDEFTGESKRDFDGVFAEIKRRPVPDLVVIGHTDTVGSAAFNDTLSRQRAEVVRNLLVARGIAAERIVVVGRGERELVVLTADNVAEPRNRRVEIQVR